MVKDFIFELGVEELPSGAVWPLADELANQLILALDKAQLSYGQVQRFATPRRLGVIISKLQAEQKSQMTTRRGPALNAAFDKVGNPTQALIGFAKSCGVGLSDLVKLTTDKGEWMVYESLQEGSSVAQLLPGFITHALKNLPIAKPMRWGRGEDEFARPVHWAVLLYGTDVIEHAFFGVKTGRMSRGHRFHHPEEIQIDTALSYESQLKKAFVLADFSLRKQIIKDRVYELAASIGAQAIMPDDLLDEVTSIVEWPVPLMAHFDEEFLDVPPEALIASMQAHQKTFALKNQQGQLLPYFITVANIESTNPLQVIQGNEKVMRARLNDAAFFFRQDKKQPLSQHIAATKKVVFQIKLGSLQDKALRMEALMHYLSHALSIPHEQAKRAAQLSKCDLMTGMVGEFPELQGLMGYYYALHDGEEKVVAQALNEQYMPRFSADHLPKSAMGLALSLADRIDTLVGIFGIGQKPSGVKDPFKLRRHALAVVRMLIATPQALNLDTLIGDAMKQYEGVLSFDDATFVELKSFILERLQSYYQSHGISAELVLAVRARQDEWLYDLDRRLHALNHFITMPEAESLTAASKRVNNLLSHAKSSISENINEQLIQKGAEQSLYEQLTRVEKEVDAFYVSADYDALLKVLACLKEPVDAFFDEVMVMVDDEHLKNNRLSLLMRLKTLLQGVADISMLQI